MTDLAGKVWTNELNARADVRMHFDRSRTIRSSFGRLYAWPR